MPKVFTQKLKNPFLLTLFLYLALIFLIKPFGNFPVNDDWIFGRQVEYFLHGGVKLSVLVDPSFVAQGALGVLWSLLFGFSFTGLKILTVVMGAFLLLGVYKVLEYLEVKRDVQLVSLFLVAFNPVIFSSLPTFMTEIYFLAFFVWSLYFYLRSVKSKRSEDSFLGSLCCGISILIRQVGVVSWIAMAIVFCWCLVEVCHDVPLRKKVVWKLLLSFLPVLVALYLVFQWPVYGDVTKSMFIEPKFFYSRIRDIIWIVPYFVYFLLPFLLSLFSKLDKRLKAILLVLALPLTWVLFQRDIFSVGSVFYVERFHAKTGFRSNLSLFDNVPFKLVVGYLVALGGLVGVVGPIHELSLRLRSPREWFLPLVAFGMLVPLFISTDLYDRYLLPAFIPLLFILASKVEVPLSKLSKIVLVLVVFSTFMLSYEYFTIQRLKWSQVRKLQKDTGLKTGIFLDGTYTKFTRAKDKKDYTGLIKTMPDGLNYTCFIQDYTIDIGSFVSRSTKSFEKWLDTYIENPVVYDRRKLEGMPWIKKHLDELSYNEEYFSPIYNVVGKKAFVGSYCLEE